MHACQRPTEDARFRVRKGAINRLLIVAGAQRFLRYAYVACFRIIQTRKTPFVLHVFCAVFLYTETVKRIRVLREDEICFT